MPWVFSASLPGLGAPVRVSSGHRSAGAAAAAAWDTAFGMVLHYTLGRNPKQKVYIGATS